ncbi:hypothetical protein K439DRAFT_926421 [Ramaria rubella]|nr:hypothetical protein K439DRAFT_926421 [Ramaria rubella]
MMSFRFTCAWPFQLSTSEDSSYSLEIKMSDNSMIPLGPVKEMDAEGLQVFDGVKHDILHRIWALHKEDAVHDLNEIRQLEHVKFYKPLVYRVQEVPYGVNFFGKILLDEKGNTVHARVFRPSENTGPIKFHSIHNRVKEEGGAIFSKEAEIIYFET